MKRRLPLQIVAGCLAAGGFVWLVGCGGRSGGSGTAVSSPYVQSIRNVVQLQSALEEYENDWDDVIPASGLWMSGITPYLNGSTAALHSPNAPKGTYGYALNSVVAGTPVHQVANPSSTPLIFDSTVTTWNATAPVSTMPNPPRYGTKNTIGYVDGSTQDQITTLDPSDLYAFSQTRLKADWTAFSLYANDYDESLPLSHQWMDETSPYQQEQSDFQSPAVQLVSPSSYGYAMESTIAGGVLSSFASPDTQVALFDSTDLTRNATDLTMTLPNPPRYGANNTIVFLGGHVQGTLYAKSKR